MGFCMYEQFHPFRQFMHEFHQLWATRPCIYHIFRHLTKWLIFCRTGHAGTVVSFCPKRGKRNVKRTVVSAAVCVITRQSAASLPAQPTTRLVRRNSPKNHRNQCKHFDHHAWWGGRRNPSISSCILTSLKAPVAIEEPRFFDCSHSTQNLLCLPAMAASLIKVCLVPGQITLFTIPSVMPQAPFWRR